jgi:hypothetical protein
VAAYCDECGGPIRRVYSSRGTTSILLDCPVCHHDNHTEYPLLTLISFTITLALIGVGVFGIDFANKLLGIPLNLTWFSWTFKTQLAVMVVMTTPFAVRFIRRRQVLHRGKRGTSNSVFQNRVARLVNRTITICAFVTFVPVAYVFSSSVVSFWCWIAVPFASAIVAYIASGIARWLVEVWGELESPTHRWTNFGNAATNRQVLNQVHGVSIIDVEEKVSRKVFVVVWLVGVGVFTTWMVVSGMQ